MEDSGDSGKNKWEPNAEVETPYYLNNRRNDLDNIALIKARHQSIDLTRTRENSTDKPSGSNYRGLFDSLGTERLRQI